MPIADDTTDQVTERNAALERVAPLIAATSRRWAGYAKTDPDDLAQDASIRFLRCWSAYDPERGSIGSYAVRCVRAAARGGHSYATALRRRDAAKAGRVNERRDADPGSPDPAALAELGDELDSLRGALRELPEQYVVYLAAQYADDLDYQEMADRHETDVATVSTRLTSAMQALRRKLGVRRTDRRRYRVVATVSCRDSSRQAREAEAKSLRRTGLTFEAIAERLGTTATTVSRLTREVAAVTT